MSQLLSMLVNKSVQHCVPLTVHFDLTYRCNERCRHCYLEHESAGELETPEVVAILQQIRKAGTLFLCFSGGEVFLRQDWPEVAVSYGKRNRDEDG